VSLGNSGSVAFKKGELVAALNFFERSIAEAEQACNLDRNDTAAQANAAWQLNKLCETCLALRDFNSLTAHVQRYAEQTPENGLRRLTAAKTLALCLKAIDQPGDTVRTGEVEGDPLDSPDAANTLEKRSPPVAELDRSRIEKLGAEQLQRAIELGTIQPSDIKDDILLRFIRQ
jgi:hypothetical protein